MGGKQKEEGGGETADAVAIDSPLAREIETLDTSVDLNPADQRAPEYVELRNGEFCN